MAHRDAVGRGRPPHQTKTDRSRKTGLDPISSRKLTPFGQGGGSVLLEIFAAVEMTFEIEVVVDGRLDGGELLKTSHRPEPVHDFLSSPQLIAPTLALLCLRLILPRRKPDSSHILQNDTYSHHICVQFE